MINETYSFKSFTNKNFLDRPSGEFSNTTIRGSSFYQEGGKKMVFPAGTQNVTFQNCNLDNVIIPENSTMEACSNREILNQNDLEDWVCVDGLPVEPVNKKAFIVRGISTDPADIPAQPLDMPITQIIEAG